MSAAAAPTWFDIGAVIMMAAGAGHALLTLIDTVRPTWFTPIDAAVRQATDSTGVRFTALFPGDASRPTMWSYWLGMNVSHGLGAFTFGLLCFLVAGHDFALFEEVGGLRIATVAIVTCYFAIALRYWLWPVKVMAAIATACFWISALLATG